jgi:hypothetical protein
VHVATELTQQGSGRHSLMSKAAVKLTTYCFHIGALCHVMTVWPLTAWHLCWQMAHFRGVHTGAHVFGFHQLFQCTWFAHLAECGYCSIQALPLTVCVPLC